jgi:hypothetical protein
VIAKPFNAPEVLHVIETARLAQHTGSTVFVHSQSEHPTSSALARRG